MPFNTYTFVLFFIVLMVVYHTISHWRTQKIVLLVASYLFYAAWNPLFILLLLFSTIVDWLIAKRLYHARSTRRRKQFLVVSLVANLGLLAYFKYGNFLVENSIFALHLIGVDFQPAPLSIILPVGISFYTFQTLSYSIDVYRGNIKPTRSFSDYALYVSFFPQLVAGPIVRANDFLPQCETPRKATSDQIGWGLSLLTIGLFMKIIIADTIFAPIVDQVFAAPEQFGVLETWVAIFAFSGQIFGDFSGYSTAAIGIALCLGFVLPDNFKAPYAALGFSDFWRRWHISLSTWLRDYLYFSLGGNRISTLRTSINLMLTMLIGGLWHGASWLFVIWGGLHGLYLVIEHFIRSKYADVSGDISSLLRTFLIVGTFILVSLTWVFFRARNLDDVITIYSNLNGTTLSTPPILTGSQLSIPFITSLALLTWHIKTRSTSIEEFFGKCSAVMKIIILSAMLLTIILFSSGDDRAFIYFQF